MKKKIQKVINNIVNWKETVEILKWIYRIGSNFKRYMLGFLIINTVPCLFRSKAQLQADTLLMRQPHSGRKCFSDAL